VVADYGQLELRVLAHLTNCKSMQDAFLQGGDFHSRTALGMYDHVKAAIDAGAPPARPAAGPARRRPGPPPGLALGRAAPSPPAAGRRRVPPCPAPRTLALPLLCGRLWAVARFLCPAR